MHTAKLTRLARSLMLAAISALAPAATAATIQWGNVSGGSWGTAGNWIPAVVPGPGDDVVFPNLGLAYEVVMEGTRSVRTINIASPGVSLWVRGSSAGGEAALILEQGGTSNGSIRFESINGGWTSRLAIMSGTFTNLGQIVANVGSGGDRRIDGYLKNSGAVTAAVGVNLPLTGVYEMAGGALIGDVPLVNSQVRVTASPPSPTTIILRGTSVLGTHNLAGVTLWVQGAVQGSNASLTAPGNFLNSGVIRLESINGGFTSQINAPSSTITNMAGGRIEARVGSGGNRLIIANVTNFGEIAAEAGTTLTIDNANRLFAHSGGALTATGGLRIVGGNFNHISGVTNGIPALIGVNLQMLGVTPATFAINGTSTVAGTIAAAQTVWIRGAADGGNADITAASGLVNNGILQLESINGGFSSTIAVSGAPLVNNGLIMVNVGTGGNRSLSGHLQNFSVVQTSLNCPIIGIYEMAGGAIFGDAPVLASEVRVTASPSGPPTTIVLRGACTLTTNNLANVTLWVQGAAQGGNASLNATTDFSNAGTIRLESINGGFTSQISAPANTISNLAGGRIEALLGSGGQRQIIASVDNSGDIAAGAGTTLTIDNSARTFRHMSGTLDATGGLRIALGTFEHTGGTNIGTPILISSSIHMLGNAPIVLAAHGASSLTGTIAAGQTLWVRGSADGGNAVLDVPAGATNAGTLRLESITGGWQSRVSISSAPLVNLALIDVATGSGGDRRFDGYLKNAGLIQSVPNCPIVGAYEMAGGRIVGDAPVINSDVLVTASPIGPPTEIVLRGTCTLLTDNLAGVALWVQGSSQGGHATLQNALPFTNHGVLRLQSINGGWGSSVVIPSGAELTNIGTIEAVVGSGGPRNLNCGLSNSGLIRVDGTTLVHTGTLANLNAGTLAGGTYDIRGAFQRASWGVTTNAAAVILRGAGSRLLQTPSTNGLSGLTTNAANGLLSLQESADLATTGGLQNFGEIALGAGSNLNVGGSYTQAETARYRVLLAGVNSASDYGRLTGSGDALLSGELELDIDSAYTPQVGDRYEIVRFATRSDFFDTVEGLDISPELEFGVEYGDDFVRVGVFKDGCTVYYAGDTNCSGAVDFSDIDCFIEALSGQAAWAACVGGNPSCNYFCVNDMNGDGLVNFSDIDRFIELLGIQ